MLVVIFGLLGSGKTYVGNLISKHFGFYYKDADDWLTKDMIDCVLNGELFTREMQDKYIGIIINNISELFRSGKKDIVISQALYMEVDRQRAMEAYPDAIFIQLETDINIIKDRLIDRKNWVGMEYGELIIGYFEPMKTAHILTNNEFGDSMLLHQLAKMLLK